MTSVRELLDDAANHAAAGRIEDARAAYSAALACSPQLAEALALGHLYLGQGRFEDAASAFDRALELAPDSVEALFSQAKALDRLRAWAEALPLLRRARALAPDDPQVWLALRGHLLRFRRQEEAFEDFRAFEPRAELSAPVVIAGLVSAHIAPGTRYEDKYLPLALGWPYARGESGYAGAAAAHAEYFDVPRAALKRLHETYNRLRQEERAGVADLVAPGERKPGPLRVGYLSADFRNHVMGRLMLEALRRHDRGRFSVRAYSIGRRELEDGLTAEFRACCDGFMRLYDLDNLDAARSIAADGLDVLVDLMGHSGSSRPGILLYKPAPVIVTHLGSHGPIGLQQIDFKMSDRHVDLPDTREYQIEAPLALSCCVLPLRRVDPAAPTILREETGLARDAVVFGVFVDLRKLSSRCLVLWRTILQRVPKGVLAFSPGRDAERPLYQRRLRSFGIPDERIAFIPRTMDDAADRARYRLVDIVLDTLPYTGGDTTAAALDMSVPVVTRVGERAAERMTWSLLAHLGVTETAAQSDAEYVEIACRLAEDAAWRTTIAAAIAARLPQSGLADFDRYARALEAAYESAVALKPAPTT